MVAMQLATEPLVRQAVRQVFQTRALLSVKPTKKGKKVRVCSLYTCIHIYMYMHSHCSACFWSLLYSSMHIHVNVYMYMLCR